MSGFSFGQIVITKAGRDKGKIFVIIDLDDEYVYLADGNLRRLEAPKKKNKKHIQPTNIIIEAIKQKNENQEKITNADIKKELIAYQLDLDNRKEV